MADETGKGLGQGLGVAAGLMGAPVLVIVGVGLILAFLCGGCLLLGLVGA